MITEAGFIGLGSMGLPMATNVIAAGVKLHVYNRTASKAAPLVAKGAVLAASGDFTFASEGLTEPELVKARAGVLVSYE